MAFFGVGLAKGLVLGHRCAALRPGYIVDGRGSGAAGLRRGHLAAPCLRRDALMPWVIASLPLYIGERPLRSGISIALPYVTEYTTGRGTHLQTAPPASPYQYHDAS